MAPSPGAGRQQAGNPVDTVVSFHLVPTERLDRSAGRVDALLSLASNPTLVRIGPAAQGLFRLADPRLRAYAHLMPKTRSRVPEETLRVVLDTNVFVAAAFNPRSHAARIVDAVREGRLRLTWNEATQRETRRILERIPPVSWEPFADLFREENRYRGTINPGWFGHVSDPDDRKFGALAYAAGATLITQDDDLLEGRSNVGVPILTPTEFLGTS